MGEVDLDLDQSFDLDDILLDYYKREPTANYPFGMGKRFGQLGYFAGTD